MKRKADFMLQNVGGEWLLVPLGAQVVDMNGLVMLNDTSACVWEMLEQDRTEEELACAITERFEVDSATACADVHTFLAEIAGMGLLEA